jgi:branched-chain amino acid transport system ATP-binding protein
MSALLEVSGLEVAYGPSQVLFGLIWRWPKAKRPPCSAATAWARRRRCAPSAACRRSRRQHPFCRRAHRRLAAGPHRPRRHRAGPGRPPVFPESYGRRAFGGLFCQSPGRSRSRGRRPASTNSSRASRSAAKNLGNQLSGGEQQMLAIGRALVTNPRLLILDEATEGLAPLVREEIWACLARLRARGKAFW